MDGTDRLKRPLRRRRSNSQEDANRICILGSSEWSVQSTTKMKRLQFCNSQTRSSVSRARLRARVPGSCSDSNVQGARKRHWNFRKYGTSKLRFPHAKEFPRSLLAVWARALKNVASHVLSRRV